MPKRPFLPNLDISDHIWLNQRFNLAKSCEIRYDLDVFKEVLS